MEEHACQTIRTAYASRCPADCRLQCHARRAYAHTPAPPTTAVRPEGAEPSAAAAASTQTKTTT